MNSFKIGNTEFGIEKVSFSIENDLLNLEITGSDDIFDELMKWIISRYFQVELLMMSSIQNLRK